MHIKHADWQYQALAQSRPSRPCATTRSWHLIWKPNTDHPTAWSKMATAQGLARPSKDFQHLAVQFFPLPFSVVATIELRLLDVEEKNTAPPP